QFPGGCACSNCRQACIHAEQLPPGGVSDAASCARRTARHVHQLPAFFTEGIFCATARCSRNFGSVLSTQALRSASLAFALAFSNFLMAFSWSLMPTSRTKR